MKLGITIKKISILFALVLVIVVVFTLFFELLDTASAPFYSAGEAIPESGEIPTVLEAVDIPTEPDPPEMPDDPPPIDDFITIQMRPSDISRGNLLLINHEHRYDVPDINDFIPIADARTASYRVTDRNIILPASVIGPLNDMMDAFHDETGRDTVTIISAFRDYERQQDVLNEYISLVGHNEALRWAARPGHSEHHAGLAFDFGIISSGTVRTFLGTGVNAWFRNNSYKYGFILRFPAEKSDITKTAYEPWHFRYVGDPHAYLMYKYDLCLEEYIEWLVDFTPEEPYTTIFDGSAYEIFFTRDTDIRIPFDCEFDISGNNIDGFIVTLKF
jgi:D-alanyl-D-alanine carboxypeptidase